MMWDFKDSHITRDILGRSRTTGGILEIQVGDWEPEKKVCKTGETKYQIPLSKTENGVKSRKSTSREVKRCQEPNVSLPLCSAWLAVTVM
jgi:hypothetical protein